MNKEGSRVGAILSSKKGVVEFFGYGIYVGLVELPKEAIGFNFGQRNPKIELDNGEIVYGCECWWGSEEKVKKELAESNEIIIVSINNLRKEAAKNSS